jgi:hypothetical protein
MKANSTTPLPFHQFSTIMPKISPSLTPSPSPTSQGFFFGLFNFWRKKENLDIH